MICSNCGTSNPAGLRFCDNCGHALSANCPNCGQPNRPTARFCGTCGESLSATAGPPPASAAPSTTGPTGATGAAAERRLVSVLFADLIGFTPFAEERDAEDVRETLSRYFDAARAVIERHGGTVEKFIGDAVMAVWGTPVAREDDAQRAVRAALQLLPVVRGLGEGLDGRAAVLSGEAAVTVGATGQAMVAGDLVNTAARLQSVAPPGSVLVGESTMRAASGAVAFEEAGEQVLKGKSAPVPAWRALRVTTASGRPADALEPPFVGRDAEMASLREMIHATTRDRRARLVLVTGPAGIGKSRLAWELEKYVDGLVEGIYWHRGRSPSYGEGITFWALGEMVRQRCRLAETDDEATTRARVAEAVAQFVPAEEDRRWVEPALLALLGIGEGPPGGREVLFAAWRIFFERIAARDTTVLLFEDLQWADSGLLDFIDHLLEWSKGLPIVVLALARPELLERRPDFGSATRHFHSLPLEPLPDEQMRELLDGLVHDLPAEACDAIVARADGIPLYAVETVRMLIADGRLEPHDGGWRPVGELGPLAVPETLRSLIAARLDALEPADRQLLQQATILGQSFTLDSLAGVSGIDQSELSERLRGLVRREMLALQADPRSPERGQYTFVQGLLREVAYGTLSRSERRGRHLAAARYLEATGDEEAAGALANHYLAAHEASQPGAAADAVATQARVALRAAAERASKLGSHAQALAYLERALHITVAPAERVPLLEAAADAAGADGQIDRAVELLVEAIDSQRAVGDQQSVARLGGMLGTHLINGGRLREALAVLTAAAESAPADDQELAAELDARLSRVHMRLFQWTDALAFADRSLAVAEPRNMLTVVAEALNNRGSSLSSLGRWREGSALVEKAAAIAEQVGAMELYVRARHNLAVLLTPAEPARAYEVAAGVLDLARRLGRRTLASHLSDAVAFHRWRMGRQWDEALAMLSEAMEDAHSPLEAGRLYHMVPVFASARGEPLADGESRIMEATPNTDGADKGIFLTALGALLFDRGEFDRAYDTYLEAQLSFGDALVPLEWAVRVALWTRDLERLREPMERLERFGMAGREIEVVRRWARAGQAALEGRADEARRALVDSIAQRWELQLDFMAAVTVVDALMLLPGDQDVLAEVARAREVFERIGARPWLERLDALVAGGTPAASISPTAASAAGP